MKKKIQYFVYAWIVTFILLLFLVSPFFSSMNNGFHGESPNSYKPNMGIVIISTIVGLIVASKANEDE